MKSVLFTTRVIWFALLCGQVMFMFFALFMIADAGKEVAEESSDLLLFYIACGMLVTLLPAGLFIRNQVYKSHWREHRVAAPGYFIGNLILLAMMEGVSFLGLVGVMLGGKMVPFILPSVVAMLVQVVNFPTGRPMEPDPMHVNRNE